MKIVKYVINILHYLYKKIAGNGVEFCLNFRALFYLIMPAIMVKMGARNNWRGIYTDLIPHCMTLSWWQMALVASQGNLDLFAYL